MTESPITRELAALADPAYQRFQSKLVPTIDPTRVLGVRAPALRRYAREMARTREDEAWAFMARLPHALYEEDNLHGELIGLLAKTPTKRSSCWMRSCRTSTTGPRAISSAFRRSRRTFPRYWSASADGWRRSLSTWCASASCS